MKKITLAACLSLFSFIGLSQFNGTHHCKGEELNKKHYEELGTWDQYQDSYQQSTHDSQGYKNFSKSAGSIPIIFHIVYNNSSDSASYADVLQVYNDLVTDFNNAGTARGGFGFNPFNADIQFCLATREPDGTPLLYPGMIIEQTTKTWFDSDNGEENMMKTAADGSQIWNRDQYMNVWICDITNGANSGTAGYAYRPAGFLPNAQIDGIVLDYNIGLTPNVLTHEVGHYMGLDHPWGGSGGCGNDDGFADTPFTDGPSFDHAESCSGNQVQCGVQTQYENFMDYANCTSMFSEDQSNHMNSVLDNLRSSLLLSNGCAPSNAPPIAAFTADLGGNPIIIPVGGSINFIDQSLNVDAASNPNWAWTFGGGSGAQAVQNPTAQFNTIGTYTVTMTVTNDYGNDAVTKVGHVEVVPPAVGTACDTLRNYDPSETMWTMTMGAGGFFAGHGNFFGDNITEYSEPFTAPATTEVRRVRLYVNYVNDISGTGSIDINVFGDDGGNHPDDIAPVLDVETVQLADLQFGWNEIDMLTPATVTGPFWVSVGLDYPATDTIALGVATAPRFGGLPNTTRQKAPGANWANAGWTGPDWGTADNMFGPGQNFSLGLDVLTSNGPAPSAVIAMPENQVCEGAVILANGSGSLNTTDYFWYNTDDPITTIYAAGTGASFGVNFPFVGDELYILFADGSCMTSVAQESIHIDAAVTASATITNTTCAENNGVITITSEAGGTGTYEYSLDGTNWVSTNVFNNMAPGDYTVYVRTPGSECQTDFQVTVGADPVFTPTVSANQEICVGESATITAGGGTGYAWIDGNTALGTTPSITVTPVTTGQYTCNVTDGSGCLVTVYTTVVVKEIEDPGFTASDFCEGTANSATITGVTGGTFAFNPAPGDGATINAATGEISNEVGGTTYTLEYTTPGVGLFCENTSTETVTVNAQEVASFTTTNFCVGAANSATITGTTGGAFAFNPAPGDGATINAGTGEISNGVAGTTYTIEYTTGGTCNDVQTQTVDVIAADDASFTVADFCEGAANTATITGTTGGTFAFNPAPGDGATINAGNGTITNGVAGTTYTVEYSTAAGPCQDITTQTVTVNAQEVASFTTTDFCVGAVNSANITGTVGGTFTFNPAPGDGATINAGTGEISNEVAGTTYTIEYTTGGTCNDVQTQTVDVIAADDASFTVADFCEGAANTATITGTTGGTFAFNPAPVDGATINAGNGTITNGVAGTTYTVEYSTAAGPCQDITTQTVTVNAQEVASFTTTDFCVGAANSANITGTTGGTFAFNPGPGDGATINAGTGEISNGVAGTTYTIEYTTGGTCNDVQTQTVNVIAPDDASFTTTDFCTGVANNATITGTLGGTFAFNPLPGDGATINAGTGEITNGVAGTTYTLEYSTPAGACQTTSTETVTVNTLDDASFTTTDYCEGSANNATITGLAGGVFTFNPAPGDGSTINGADGEITNGIAGTTYTLEYTTPAGACQNTSTQTVSVIVDEDASFNLTDYCTGSPNAASAIATTGGVFIFSVAPGDGATINGGTGEITGGILGTTYSVEYTTPGVGCQNSSIETVTVIGSDDPSFTTTDFCFNSANSATITGTTGGVFTFTTPPGDGATINGADGEITNGVAGSTYGITYTTPLGVCQADQDENVTVLTLDDASFSTTDYCVGTANAATISGVPGGTFAFNPSGGAASINPSTGGITNGVAGTTYFVEYTTPATGCSNTQIETVTVLNGDDASFALTDFCAGDPNAATSIITGGGTFDFTSPVSDGATINGANGTITGGVQGTTYSVDYTTPAGGCPSTSTETVSVNNLDDATFTFDDFCLGAANAATGIVTPGGNFSFNTAPGDGATIDNSTGEVSNGIAGATYDILYTTNAVCPATSNITVSVNTADDATFTLNDFCVGTTNGATSIATPGGTFDFTTPQGGVTIDNATGEITNGVSGASYDVIYTTPASGCQGSSTETVNVNNTPTIVGTVTNIQCNGDTDGAIDVTITDAIPTSITWTNTAQTTEDVNGLTANAYEITVDAGGCVNTETFTIIEPDAVSIDVLNVEDIICNGNYGSATVQTSGGTGTLTADWGGNNPALLPAGNYTVIVTDDNGCSAQQSFDITEPPVFTVTGVMTEESVANDGAIDLTVTGGLAPYTFNWSTNETTEDISGLAPGTYTVTVTDALGCSYLLQFDVTSTVGIKEQVMNEATVFPNPFHTQFEISLKGQFDFTVQDARGKVIQYGVGNNSHLVNLENRETGVYFVRLSQEDNFRVIKMIKR